MVTSPQAQSGAGVVGLFAKLSLETAYVCVWKAKLTFVTF